MATGDAIHRSGGWLYRYGAMAGLLGTMVSERHWPLINLEHERTGVMP